MAKETILILDADKHIAWTLKTLLEAEEYLAVVSDSVEKAVKNFSEVKVSGVITEYIVDSVCTLEAIRRLKGLFPETYVMMITDNEIREDEYEEVMQSGVDDFFLKPIPIKKILLHLGKGMRHRSLLIEKERLEKEVGNHHLFLEVSSVPEAKEA